MAGAWSVGRKADDLTDKRFGRLVAYRIAKRDKDGIYWLCECDCGNYVAVHSKNLKKGKTKSCGCYRDELLSQRAIPMVNKRFGKLVVIRRAEPPKNVTVKNRPYWLCKCDCGKTKVVLGINLRKGYTRSCGCIRKETVNKVTLDNY